eukprot:c13520_g1_i1 orf=800-1021(+)
MPLCLNRIEAHPWMVEACTLKCAASSGKKHQRLPCYSSFIQCPKFWLINPQVTPTLAIFFPLALALVSSPSCG